MSEPFTEEMMREFFAHIPLGLTPPEKWEWCADYLNQTLKDPDAVCPCCNVSSRGEIMDHLPIPPIFQEGDQ